MNRALFWLCACCFAGAPALGQQSTIPAPTAEEVREQIRRLDPRRDASERRTALAWLSQRADSERTDAAIPALERCVRDDPEPDVRRRAIATWARLELRRKRPCPAGLIEAMLSPTDEVRWEAGVWVGQFREFAPGAIPVMLRGAKSATPDIRGNILFPLARAARKDRRLLAEIRGRTKDADWDVRDCAHLALYRATDQVEDYLLYLARERHAARKAVPGGEGESAEGKRLRERRNLLLIGAAGLLSEWLASRPKATVSWPCAVPAPFVHFPSVSAPLTPSKVASAFGTTSGHNLFLTMSRRRTVPVWWSGSRKMEPERSAGSSAATSRRPSDRWISPPISPGWCLRAGRAAGAGPGVAPGDDRPISNGGPKWGRTW